MIPDPILPIAASAAPQAPRQSSDLRAAAEQMEANFLAEMLRSAAPDQAGSAFGGGPGEEHFLSFLHRAQAEEMTRAGGIGLAETLYRAMQERIGE